MADALSPEVNIWTDAQRAPNVGRVLDLLGDAVRPVAVAGPRSAPVSDLARRMGVQAGDDFRKSVIDHPAAFVLLASVDGVAAEDVASLVARGSTVLALEPVADSFDSLLAPRLAAAPSHSGGVVMLPSFLRSPGWVGAANPAELVGQPRMLAFTSFGQNEEASLYARLYDAWTALLALAPIPESIDASFVGPLPEVPDSPRGLVGHLAAHARMPNGASAVIRVSDRVGRPSRWLQIIGDQGRADLGDLDYQIFDNLGHALDRSKSPPGAAALIDLVVAYWRKLLDRPELAHPAQPLPPEPHILACCLASQLSCKTRQPESPRTLLRLHGHE